MKAFDRVLYDKSTWSLTIWHGANCSVPKNALYLGLIDAFMDVSRDVMSFDLPWTCRWHVGSVRWPAGGHQRAGILYWNGPLVIRRCRRELHLLYGVQTYALDEASLDLEYIAPC